MHYDTGRDSRAVVQIVTDSNPGIYIILYFLKFIFPSAFWVKSLALGCDGHT